MKRTFFLILAVAYVFVAQAQLNANEKVFQNRIKSFISEEGYKPEIDSDEDISFKIEGVSYWIHISEEEDGYFYASFHIADLGCVDADKYACRRASNEVTSEYKIGKCWYSEENDCISISIQGFYFTPTDFTKFFTRYAKILKLMRDDLKEYYGKYS